MIEVMSSPSRVALALASFALACGHDRAITRPPEEGLGVPMRFARTWATALAPNQRGGWNFITQAYELGSGKPTEFVVLDLATGASSIFEGPPDIYTNSNYQLAEQLRATNGRIFFPETEGHMAYYDPSDERVKQLGRVLATKDDIIYRMVFGPDGILYGGTQSKGLPNVFQLDPQTLKVQSLGTVGKNRVGYSYAYYLAADPPWLYVAVGQDPWELVALDLRTGASRVLATRPADGFMQLDTRPNGISATLISKLRAPDQRTDMVWCVDGQLQPYAGITPPPARRVQPRASPIAHPPELDLSHLNPSADGVGHVSWRLGNEAWRSAAFKVKYTSAIEIESLVALPDGTMLGNARQYHGFFRFDPKKRATTQYGAFPISGGPRVMWKGHLFAAGYPSSALYEFDPTRPWSSGAAGKGAANPRLLGAFTSGAHYPYFLVPSANGRLYYAGRRERSGVGGAVGYYDPAHKSFSGHHERLESLDPQGFVVLDAIQRIVYSGRVQSDAGQASANDTAQLVVFGADLAELERLTVKPGVKNTGTLFATHDGEVIGISASEHAVYRFDVAKRQLVDWRDIAGAIGPSAQHADGSIWLAVDDTLVQLDASLQMRVVRKLETAPAPGDLFAWQRDQLYWAHGAELRVVNPVN